MFTLSISILKLFLIVTDFKGFGQSLKDIVTLPLLSIQSCKNTFLFTLSFGPKV